MNSVKYSIIFFAFALCGFSLPVFNADELLRSSIQLDKSDPASIQISYSIKNISGKPVTIWHCGFWCNNKIIVTDAGNKEVPLTDYGKQTRQAFSPGGGRDKNFKVVLEPSEVDSSYEKYDLGDYFVLKGPATYYVQYVYHEKDNEGEIEVFSNKLEIFVKK